MPERGRQKRGPMKICRFGKGRYGVVRDGKYRSLDEPPENYAFVPYAQRYNPSVVLL